MLISTTSGAGRAWLVAALTLVDISKTAKVQVSNAHKIMLRKRTLPGNGDGPISKAWRMSIMVSCDDGVSDVPH